MSYTHGLGATHSSGVSDTMSYLLDPQLLGVSSAVLPITRGTLHGTVPSFTRHLGHVNLDRLLDRKLPSNSQPPSNHRDMMQKTMSLSPFFGESVLFRHSGGHQSNMFRTYSESQANNWLNYQSPCGHHTEVTQIINSPLKLELKSENYLNKVRSNILDDYNPQSDSQFVSKNISENQDSRIESQDDIGEARTSEPQQASNELAQESQTIKHSIREILKPRENSHLSNNNDSVKKQQQRHNAQTSELVNKSRKRLSKSLGFNTPCLDESATHLHPSTFYCNTQHNKDQTLSYPKMLTSGGNNLGMNSSHAAENSQKHRMAIKFLKYQISTPPEVISVIEQQEQSSASFNPATSRGLSERKSFQCPQCRYLTDRKNNLKRHIVTMHQESGKVLECCGIPFQSKAALRDHNTIFHRGGYRCRICARNFCRKALLRRHLSVHSGQKDFFCELCGYATSHKSNLERHQKVHNKKLNDDKGKPCMGYFRSFREPANKGHADTVSYHPHDAESPKRLKQDGVGIFTNKNINISNNDLNDNVFKDLNSDDNDNNNSDRTNNKNTNINNNIESIGNKNSSNNSNANAKVDLDSSQAQQHLTSDDENQDHISRQKILTSPKSRSKRFNIFTSRLEATHSHPCVSSQSNTSSITALENESESKLAELPLSYDVIPFSYETFACENASNNQYEIHGEDHLIPKYQKANTNDPDTLFPLSRDTGNLKNDLDKNKSNTDNLDTLCSSLKHGANDAEKSLDRIAETKSRKNAFFVSSQPEVVISNDDVTRYKRCKRKSRMWTSMYRCDGCGQKLPSQFHLQSHSCTKSSREKIIDISLVIALQKGTLKGATASLPLISQ